MIQFHATAVEVFSEEEGIVTVHFDDQGDHYLQLQYPEVDDPIEFEHGYGNVYVEVDDQINSGFNCFSRAELTRGGFRLVLARDPALERLGEVVATFDLDGTAFEELRAALRQAFRAFDRFTVSLDAPA
ncbi:hypothetical protein [Limnoglobus roseus]|uniref:Uncharacterized protein n=1 Tax=Limnoglobus roseus TaxID=2598579 RepID=A0A5C1ANI4_9BACT|nr:hypothetical protein [Limnoglobus roseus]QEL20125.1 hypothetical protein PX52LOC_07213 [Limnoglobus roseus]